MVLRVGVLVGLVSFMIMLAMNLQKKQSSFDNTIESIRFECALAYDEKYELRENLDHNYVQQIIWKADSIQHYPDSFTSRILLKQKDNRLKADQIIEEVKKLGEEYLNKTGS